MSDVSVFADFLRRVRAGDDEAAVELVRQYEPAIRLEVRLRLRDPRLYRLFDSLDICQSVLASFFVRAAAGGYELHNSQQLLALLVKMARNKLAFQARKQRAQCRDNRRLEDVPLEDIAHEVPSPSRLVAGQELLQQVRQRLGADERQLLDLRAQGQEWSDIAGRLGGSPQACRMQLSRALERVSRELGLDEEARDV